MPPVKVKVKFFAPFRELFGAKEKELVFNENPDLIELLDRLAETPAARPEIFKDDQVREDLVIMINGSIVSHDTLTGLKLEDGATVTIFPLMGGG
ncbi:MAG TPA: MoaD/ThiS family protein [Candidatus Saccharicenans sp.]|nr:MoaD/ThiS family protein [Candidatus Saccharicenans sp.]HRT26437.1 MoaD/ThiS family protein [Candidatus Saccharicenans sp.]